MIRSAASAYDKGEMVSQDVGKDRGQCVTVIFNPISGQNDPEQRKAAIEEALAVHGYTCQYVVTTPKHGARHVAEEARNHGVDLVAVSGGDGTAVEVMAALIGKDIPVAVFPAGTGNLLAINLGIPQDIAQAAHTALFGQRRWVDLARISFRDQQRHFAIIAGVGYDAKMIGDADRDAKARLGVLAYVWAAVKNLGHRPVHATIHLDAHRTPLQRRATSVMVVNMSRLQGEIELIPDAHPDDGALEVAILKAERVIDWLRLLLSAVRSSARNRPFIEYHKARSVTVDLTRTQPLQFDGERAGDVRTFTVEIIPKAVQVMVPPSHEA
jgi:YegS/Rv2252/BmrU family lipid kinase